MDFDADASWFEGYECKFVKPPPKQLQIECPICLEILREPHIVSCCGHSFCQRCIGRILSELHPCPMCKRTGYTIMDNQGLKRTMYDFHVRCPHRHVGCDWTGKLRNLLPHLNDNRQTPDLKGCPYTKLICPLCKGKVYRAIFKDHKEKQCPQREYTCEYCKKYRATFENVACRHWELCEQFLLPCPNNCEMSGNDAKKFIERRKLEHHVNEECPLTLVACALRYAGCTVKLCRKDVTEHMREESSTHLSLLAAENLTLVKKLHDKDECMTQLVQLNSELRVCMDQQQEAHLALKKKVAALKSDEAHLALRRKVAALTNDLTGAKKLMSDRHKSQINLSSKIAVAASQAQHLVKKREIDQELFLELSEKVSSQAKELARLQEFLQTGLESVDDFQFLQKDMDVRLHQLTHANSELRVYVQQQQEGLVKITEVSAIKSDHAQTKVKLYSDHVMLMSLSSEVTKAVSQIQQLNAERQQEQALIRDLSVKVSSQAEELTYLQETAVMQVEVLDIHFKEQQVLSKIVKSVDARTCKLEEQQETSRQELEWAIAALMQELSELRKADTHEKEVRQKALTQKKETRRKVRAQEKDIQCRQLKEIRYKLESQQTLLKAQEKRYEELSKSVTALQHKSAGSSAVWRQSLPHLSDDHNSEEVRQKEELDKSVSALRQELAECSTALTQDLLQLYCEEPSLGRRQGKRKPLNH